MLITAYFDLPEDVPFVNVDTHEDARLFVQPFLILQASKYDPFAQQAINEYHDFGHRIISGVVSKDPRETLNIKDILSNLGEPPETRLGYAPESHKGKGVAGGYGLQIFHALKKDLQPLLRPEIGLDFAEIPCFVEGIDADRVSDMTISVVRNSLIDYTAHMMDEYPQFTSSGHDMVTQEFKIWDVRESNWGKRTATLPVAGGHALLLVPKSWTHGSLLVGSMRYHGVTVLGRVQEEQSWFDPYGKLRKPSKKDLGKTHPRNRKWDRDYTVHQFEDKDINLIERFRGFVNGKYEANQQNGNN